MTAAAPDTGRNANWPDPALTPKPSPDLPPAAVLRPQRSGGRSVTQALVHLGIPKTGSSTIQKFLAANVQALAAQGIGYLPSPLAKNHIDYLVITFDRLGKLIDDVPLRLRLGITDLTDQHAWASKAEAKIAADLAQFPGKRWLISCEMLGWPFRSEDFCRAFQDWAQGIFSSVQYIVFLRAQDSWLCSEYSQRLRNGSTDTLATLCQFPGAPDYNAFLNRWERVAGPENVTARLYPGSQANWNLITDFCAAAGIDPTGFARPRQENLRLSSGQADRLLRLNRVFARRPDTRARHVLRAVLRNLILHVWPDRSEPLALDPAMTRTLRLAVAPSNETLRRTRFADRDSLFPAMHPPHSPLPMGSHPIMETR
jgi:hypothetical protein